MALPAPPPLLSEVKASSGGGVIVKHDGGPLKSQQMPSSLQVIPTSSMGINKSLPSPNHYKSGGGPGPPPSQSQLLFEYRNPTSGSGPPNIVSIHATSRDSSPQSHQPQMIYTDRYKMQSYPSPQSMAQQRQSPASGGYQRQAPSPKQIPPPQSMASGYTQVTQNKPKVSSPAPAHIYGKPESGPIPNAPSGAGIMSGIPICRAGTNYVIPSMHVVSKSSAMSVESTRVGSIAYPVPSSAPQSQQQQRGYGVSGPPPAHSRGFEPQSAWSYGNSAPPPHSSLLQSAAPVSISVNPSPASALNRSPGAVNSHQLPGQTSSHTNSGHSISVSLSHVPDVQTQPLDLGTSDRSRDSMHSNHSSESKSPPAPHGGPSLKRKSNTPINYHHQSPVGHLSNAAAASLSDMKRKRFDFPSQPQPLQHQQQQQQMPPSQYPSPHHVAAVQYPPGLPPHPSYGMYQGGPGSVAIHPVPGPPHHQQQAPMSVAARKDVTPPISVVVSVSDAQKPLPMLPVNEREIFKGQTGTAVVTNSITITTRPEEHPPAITITTSTLPVPPVNSKPIVLLGGSNSPAATPIKLPFAEPEKSVSPVPKFSHSGPRNLKKAWLQRHSGEDTEDKVTGTVPNSSIVAEPIKPTNGLNNGNGLTTNSTAAAVPLATATPVVVVKQESTPIKSISSVGSMAVNSVLGGELIATSATVPSNGNKVPQHPKKTAVLNSSDVKQKMAVDTDSDAKEDSSSSDQVSSPQVTVSWCPRLTTNFRFQEHTIKTPPKKKQAKSKRKKGGGRKPVAKKKRGATAAAATAAASESDNKNSDSDKESASDKDSDSGTSTSQGKLSHGGGRATSNGSAEKNSPAKSDVNERRKRGRRPKVTKDVPL